MQQQHNNLNQAWYQEMAKTVVPGLQERLRSLVNGKGWDYVVYWKLNDDQRFIDWVGCCCGGVAPGHGGLRPDHCFSTPAHFLDAGGSCPDISFPHPATKTCGLLSALALTPSMPLDSAGVHAQVLLSGQPRWMSFPMDGVNWQDGLQTKVYIPIQNGIVELASSNQMSENAAVIQNVKAKCGDPWQEFQNFQETVESQGFKSLYKNPGVEDGLDKHFNHGPDQIHWTSALENHPWDHEAVGLSESQFALNIAPTQLNFLGKTAGQDSHFEKPAEKPPALSSFVPSLQDQVPQLAPPAQQHGHAFSESPHASGLSTKDTSEVKQETRADSSDCSDQVDDEDEKATGRSGRRHLSKNLVAERKRRKKLNERLYSLRALVPKITKMDRASILGDAIEYVKELQQQVKELQEELEDESQHAGNMNSAMVDCVGLQLPHGSEGTLMDHDGKCGSKADDQINEKKMEDLTQPMQVEVSKMDAHLLTLRIFCEKRPGVFVKLMQALDALGLDVLHANITTFRGLVLNVFNAEIRDKELMQAEQVKETLLEMTSQPDSRGSSLVTENSHLGVITIDN